MRIEAVLGDVTVGGTTSNFFGSGSLKIIIKSTPSLVLTGRSRLSLSLHGSLGECDQKA